MKTLHYLGLLGLGLACAASIGPQPARAAASRTFCLGPAGALIDAAKERPGQTPPCRSDAGEQTLYLLASDTATETVNLEATIVPAGGVAAQSTVGGRPWIAGASRGPGYIVTFAPGTFAAAPACQASFTSPATGLTVAAQINSVSADLLATQAPMADQILNLACHSK